MRRTWLFLAVLFAAGAFLGARATVWPWITGAIFLLTSRWAFRWTTVALGLAAIAAGAVTGSSQTAWRQHAAPRPSTPLVGTVERVTLRGPSVEIWVAPDPTPLQRVRVRQHARPPGLAPGARVLLTGTLELPPPADNPGQFDGRAYAERSRIRWQTRSPVRLLEPAPQPAETLIRVRQASRHVLAELGAPYGAAVLAGILLGDRKAVPPSAKTAFEATGTGHLLAVSGLHVGGLAAALAWLVAALALKVGSARPGRWGGVVALPGIVAMVALAQFPLSACRAGLMVGLVIVGRLMGRPADPLNLLGFAALLALAAEPDAASMPGFQLSFGVVAGLLAVGPRHRGVVGALGCAVVASAVTLPIQAWHFGTIAPIAPLANLILVPLASLGLVPLAALGMLLAPMTPCLLEVAAHLAQILVAIAEAMADLGGGVVPVGRASVPLCAAPLIALVGIRLGKTHLGVLAAVGVISFVWLMPLPAARVDFMAVGQGDATLVRNGDRAALFDGGPDPRARALLQFLRHQGVSRIDWMVLSHPHPDHYAGLAAVAETLEVGTFVHNGRRSLGAEIEEERAEEAMAWKRLASALRAGQSRIIDLGTRPLPATRTVQIGLGSVRILVDGTSAKAEWSDNDASLIAHIEGPGASVLLTGDIERDGEQALTASLQTPVTVLKAPHHGSHTSSGSELLDRARPSAVVFNTGRGNRFRFPSAPVLKRYRTHKVPAWRTDQDGLVSVDIGLAPQIWSFHRPDRVRLRVRPKTVGADCAANGPEFETPGG